MNKKAKIAIAAVSVVMAGTMAVGMFGCQGGRTPANTDNTISGGAWDAAPSAAAKSFVERLNGTEFELDQRVDANASAWQKAKGYWENYLKGHKAAAPVAEGANLSYTAGTQIDIAIGHQDEFTNSFYSTVEAGTTLPGGDSAVTGGLKPAVKAIQDSLGVTFNSGHTITKTSGNLAAIKDVSKWGNGVDICTTDLAPAVASASNNNDILNLGDYLDKMPNFKNFLEENPIVYLSLLGDGFDTATGANKNIYVAPYFDGNDDIERYAMCRQDWVVDLLDKDIANDGAKYCDVMTCDETNVTYVKGYMGTTGQVVVETSKDESGATFLLKKDYNAALEAAKAESSELGAAYKAIAGEAYNGESGNIVDIMDAALLKNKEATGKQLAMLYRAYIDVAYKDASNYDEKAYATRSDVFNGVNAAWDVDDLVAMLRIVRTNGVNVGLSAEAKVTGIYCRSSDSDRTADLLRLVGSLYGERGVDSRYENTYIDADGKLKDARGNASLYQALENFGMLAKEGHVIRPFTTSVDGEGNTAMKQASWTLAEVQGDCKTNPGTGFFEYDYSQTQTGQMFNKGEESADKDYVHGAINNPVSRWDDNGDGKKETIMRFTESWRSTKTGGLAVAANVKNDQNKLNAVLTFIDYLYSNDGQILTTFGKQSTNGDTNPNGTWYGNEVTGVDIATVAHKEGGQYVVNDDKKGEYFTFKDKLYTGEKYKGKMTPKITSELFASFTNKDATDKVQKLAKKFGSFTDYARRVLGATLPMGVKDQSLENQLTATDASKAASRVSVSLANGTIKHVELKPTDNPWYTCVPSSLPLTTTESNVINAASQKAIKEITGDANGPLKKKYSPIFWWIVFEGYNGTYSQNGHTVEF